MSSSSRCRYSRTRSHPSRVRAAAPLPHPAAPPHARTCRRACGAPSQNAILLELEQGVGTDKCNSLVIGLMRKALTGQMHAAHARQANNLDSLWD